MPNLEKSGFFFFLPPKNASRNLKQRISTNAGIGMTAKNSTYIGNPMFIQRNKLRVFQGLLDKIANLAEGWQAKFLSSAGKATFTSLVLQSIPIYMKTLKIPISVCKKVDSIIKRFWWNHSNNKRYLALHSWRQIFLPKDYGGLGFLSFHNLNLAMLAKLGWNLATNVDKMWVTLLLNKYYQNHRFLEVPSRQGYSFIWKRIFSTINLTKKRFMLSN